MLSVEEVFVAEVSVDERRLLKTMRWYDGFVIGLANPGFLIVGIGFSVGALGAKVAAILWFVSALDRRSSGLRVLRAGGDVPGQAGRPRHVRQGRLAQVLLAGRPDRDVRLLVRLVERAGHLRRADRVPAGRRVLHQLELQGSQHRQHRRLDGQRGGCGLHNRAGDRPDLHLPVLVVQRARHAAGRVAQLRDRRGDGGTGDRAGGRPVRDGQHQQPRRQRQRHVEHAHRRVR